MRCAFSPLLTFLALILSACDKRPAPALEPPGPPSAAPIAAVSTEPLPSPIAAAKTPSPAEAAFERYCAECHRSGLETAKPEALAAFDLANGGWLGAMTEAQLRAAMGRFKGMSKVGEDERKAAQSMIDAELARRQAKGEGG